MGYTLPRRKIVRVPTTAEIAAAYGRLGLSTAHLMHPGGLPTRVGKRLLSYLEYRANVLNLHVEPRLMNVDRARSVFSELRDSLSPRCPLPMNKQRGEKRGPAYLTCIVNMLIEAHSRGHPCDYDPRSLTKFTRNNAPLRTLARRVDGAFPSTINPVAVWEIKEYYYTTTFGSRVADGVYETLLDGMELAELSTTEGVRVRHYLIVDSHYTWWECGRSYLCRMVDMLHMGYVDEILFGYETVERLPGIVQDWIELAT
ncbi:MAG: hypothetical protein OXH15_06950 [Gammaproteobacteria bacterium]|nr:hypothetical protein [Gammaproteobacteria bacterium]